MMRLITILALSALLVPVVHASARNVFGESHTAQVFVDGEHRMTIENFERVFSHGAYLVLIEEGETFPRCEVRGRYTNEAGIVAHLVCYPEGWHPVMHDEDPNRARVEIDDHTVTVMLEADE